MISSESTYLDRLDVLLDDIGYTLYNETFGSVYMTIFMERPDWSQISQALEEYAKAGLPEILKELVEFPVTALRREILKNLSFFERKSQEDAYIKMLIDLPYSVGVHIGIISFFEPYTKSLYESLPENYSHLTLLLNHSGDMGHVAFILQNILDATNVFSDNERDDTGPQPIEPIPKLQWKGDKTDLAELVWALWKSGRIVDVSTGQPATQKELTNQIVNLLGVDSLDMASLMKGRYGAKNKATTFKVQDGKTFVNTLQTLLNQRAID